jgi:hypothetical protein
VLAPNRLLPLVRFPLMSDEELAALSGHPLRHKSAVLSTLVAEARACHAADEARQLHSGANSVQQVGPPWTPCCSIDGRADPYACCCLLTKLLARGCW